MHRDVDKDPSLIIGGDPGSCSGLINVCFGGLESVCMHMVMVWSRPQSHLR